METNTFKFNTIEFSPKFHNREDWITFLDWSGISVLIVLAISLPISSITSTRDICLGLVFISWITRSAISKNWHPIKTPLDRAWAVYGVFVLLSLLTAVDFLYSLDQFRGEYIKNFLLFLFVFQFVSTEKRAKVVLLGIVVGNALMVSYGIIEFIIKFMIEGKELIQPWWGSLHGGNAAYSTYLITVLPFLIWFLIYWRKWWVVLMAIILIGANVFSICISFQRAAWVAFLATIFTALVIIPINVKLKMISIITLLAAVGIAANLAPRIVLMRGMDITNFEQIIQEKEKYIPRLEIWTNSIKNLYSNPIKGAGIGRASLHKKYPYYRLNKTHWHAHNTFLNIGLQLGIQGLIAFLYLLARLFLIGVKGLRTCEQGSLSHYLGGSLIIMIVAVVSRDMFNDFFVDDTALLFWFLSGLVVAVIQRETVSPTKEMQNGFTEESKS